MPTCVAVKLLALAAGVLPFQAFAGELKPVADSVLAEMRGGFVSAGGLTFDIGITTSTYINGKLAANATVATSPTAPTGPTAPTSPTAPAGAAAAAAVAGPPASGGGPVAAAPTGPAPAPGAAGAQIVTTATADGGQTTVIQDPGKLVNLVANTANGQDIRLDTQVNLVLPGFDAVQRNQLLSGMGMKIGADGSFGVVSALPH